MVDGYCDFKFNVPSASHLGGVWERQIRTVGSVLVPMLEFQQADVYSRKKMAKSSIYVECVLVQMENEYLQTLQMWSKWNENTSEVFKGDIVIIKDDNQPRNGWLLAVVVETFPSEDGHVRKVKVRTGNGTQNYLERPIHKLVVLVEV